MAVVLVVAMVLAVGPISVLAQAKKAVPTDHPLAGFDAWVEQEMKTWMVPGLAVAVVKDGEVILLKGYGYRDVEKQLPVTPQTLFAIGSITKSFTVLDLATLVDEGKLEWDKPVREYLPEFRLYDQFASDRMTPRDLVTHRSGLPRHDALWYNATFSRRDMVERLRHLEPSRDFRAVYQYQNLMFMTAGYLAERLTGKKWEEVTRERLLEPLGMTRSNFSVLESEKDADFAQPYQKAKEELKRVPFRVIDEMGPAGSINSSVEEMSRYLLLHMNKGKVGEKPFGASAPGADRSQGKQLVSAANITQMHTPQMVASAAPPQWPELGYASYGMGLQVTSYSGNVLVNHGGAIDGFWAYLSFLPQKNLGVVALSNRGGQPLPMIVTYQIYDRLLGVEPAPWSQRFKEQQEKSEAAEEEAKKKGYTPRVEGTQPSHKIEDYAGRYEHPGYGIASIELGEGPDSVGAGDAPLRLTFNRMNHPLAHFHYDVFEIPEDPLDPFEKTKVQFGMNSSGQIDRLLIPLEPNVKEIVFTRMAEEQMRQRSFLEPLTGEYVLGAQTVAVTLQGDDTLILSVPGQRPYELVPRSGTTFDIKGLTGFSLEFKKDAAGAVVEVVFYQPNGTFVAKRK
jgi:CubicO group peptidase (beta-lactamase class C family)